MLTIQERIVIVSARIRGLIIYKEVQSKIYCKFRKPTQQEISIFSSQNSRGQGILQTKHAFVDILHHSIFGKPLRIVHKLVLVSVVKVLSSIYPNQSVEDFTLYP